MYNNNNRRKEVGENCTLYLPEEVEVAVSNVSFTEEANTSEVQYTDSFAQSIAVTGVTYSGSFEIPGNANDTRETGWDDGSGEDGTTLPNYIRVMSIEDSQDNAYTFTNVLINSHNKDIPSDDRTTQSFDFMAEEMVVE
jgi:hypothetical protein